MVSGQQAPPQFPSTKMRSNADLTYRIIDAPHGTLGYEILSDGELLIHQTNVPGRPGNDGCRNKEEAERLAALVIEKIKQGEMPPTISAEELKVLNIP